MSVDLAKAGLYASDANFGARRGLSDPTIANNLGNRGAGALLRVGLLTGALFVASLAPVAWHKFNSGVTVTGAGVSQWDDATGLGHHLLQGTDAARPPLQADGSILFDGVGQFLKATGYTLVQPETIYLLMQQVTWTALDYCADGNARNSGLIRQQGASPALVAQVAATSGLTLNNQPLNAYAVLCVVFNTASSLMQINAVSVAGPMNAGDMAGFTLAAAGDSANFANIQVKEALIFPVAHTGITKARMVTYAAGVGNLLI